MKFFSDRSKDISLVGAILCTLLAIVPFVVFALKAEIVADDFAYFSNYDEKYHNPIAYTVYHYSIENGRFGQSSFVAITYAIFGYAAIKIVPIIFLLAISSLFAGLLLQNLEFKRHGFLYALCGGASLTASGLLLSPSMFDSFLWLTSSTVYLGGVMFMLLTFWLAGQATIRNKRSWLWLVGAAFTALYGSGFSEPLTLCAAALAAVFSVIMILKKRIWQTVVYTTVAFVLAVGFLLIYISPGTTIRRTAIGHTPDLLASAKGTAKITLNFLDSTDFWKITILIVAAIIMKQGLQKAQSASGYYRLVSGATLIISLFFVTHIFLSLLASGGVSLRTYTTPALAFAATLFLTIFCLIDKIKLPQLVATVILAGIFAAVMLPYYRSTASALDVRGKHLQMRMQSINQQLKSGADKITVQALPVLLESEAVDLANPPTKSEVWAELYIRLWYKIPTQEQMVITEKPKQRYCAYPGVTVKYEYRCP